MLFLNFKFFFAVLPLIILGYILGALIIAYARGLVFSPAYPVFNVIGILIGLYNFRQKYLAD